MSEGDTPVPDPTALTTDQLERAEERMLRAVANVENLLRAESEGMERECGEKFQSVDQRFELVERQRVEQKTDCVEASTPVLCADLIWRPAGELEVGDELVAFDEGEAPVPGRRGTRMFRRAKVTANSLREDDLLLVETPDGSVRCNPHHPFLTKRTGGPWYWARADALRVGDHLMRPVDVWEVDRSWEGGWLAGIFDGEGCLHHAKDGHMVRLSVVQCEGETATRIAEGFAGRVGKFSSTAKTAPPGCKPQKQFAVSRRADVLKLLGSVRPSRLLARADAVWEGHSIGGKGSSTVITGVAEVGRGTIAELSVSTKTYIAGGFAVHNTKDAVDAAFSAAKEAVREQTTASDRAIQKSETSMLEQLKQLGSTFTAATDALRRDIDDLKERQTTVESRKEGSQEVRSAQSVSFGQVLALVSTGVGFLSLLTAVVVAALT